MKDWMESGLTVEDYLLSLKRRSIFTFNSALRSFRLLEKFTGLPITSGFKFSREPIKPVKLPSREELRRFYFALASERDRAIFMVLLKSGLRPYEALKLKMENINLEKRIILIFERMDLRLKNTGGRCWFTFVDEEGATILREYLKEERADGYLFPSLRKRPLSTKALDRIFEENSKRVGIQIRPYDLRKWFENQLRKAGISSEDIDFMAGRSQKTTLGRHYLAYEEGLREIYDRADLKILS